MLSILKSHSQVISNPISHHEAAQVEKFHYDTFHHQIMIRKKRLANLNSRLRNGPEETQKSFPFLHFGSVNALSREYKDILLGNYD